jgi:hypothetical protein
LKIGHGTIDFEVADLPAELFYLRPCFIYGGIPGLDQLLVGSFRCRKLRAVLGKAR